MTSYEIQFNDGEHFASAPTLKEAEEIRNENNFQFLSRSLHIYRIIYINGRYDKIKIV